MKRDKREKENDREIPVETAIIDILTDCDFDDDPVVPLTRSSSPGQFLDY